MQRNPRQRTFPLNCLGKSGEKEIADSDIYQMIDALQEAAKPLREGVCDDLQPEKPSFEQKEEQSLKRLTILNSASLTGVALAPDESTGTLEDGARRPNEEQGSAPLGPGMNKSLDSQDRRETVGTGGYTTCVPATLVTIVHRLEPIKGFSNLTTTTLLWLTGKAGS